MKAEKSMKIAELIDIDRGIAAILMNAGMHCVGCMAAAGESLEEAAIVHGLNPDVITNELNAYLNKFSKQIIQNKFKYIISLQERHKLLNFQDFRQKKHTK